MDPAEVFDDRLRWWRIHCASLVALLVPFIGYGIVGSPAWALPAGCCIALFAYAGLKADRTVLPLDRDRSRSEPEGVPGWPDGVALEGGEAAGLQVLVLVGIGVAIYSAFGIVQSALG